MRANKLELGQFIHWDWGQNYPFNACMAKLMECLGVGFNCTIETLHNKEKTALIAKKILHLAEINDKIMKLLH